MGLFPDTRFDDWTKKDVGSFAKRYFEPLWRVATLDFPAIDHSRAQDLAQAFLVRELERVPVFERYAPGARHDAKFRTYLRTCFYRFCRDELAKERRHAGASLDALSEELPEEGAAELDRLIARDLLRHLRGRILEGGRAPLAPDAASYFQLKWPEDLEAAPASDQEVAEALGLTRAKLRTLKRKVVDRILVALRQELHEEGLTAAEVDRAIEGYVTALGREDPSADDPEDEGAALA